MKSGLDGSGPGISSGLFSQDAANLELEAHEDISEKASGGRGESEGGASEGGAGGSASSGEGGGMGLQSCEAEEGCSYDDGYFPPAEEIALDTTATEGAAPEPSPEEIDAATPATPDPAPVDAAPSQPVDPTPAPATLDAGTTALENSSTVFHRSESSLDDGYFPPSNPIDANSEYKSSVKEQSTTKTDSLDDGYFPPALADDELKTPTSEILKEQEKRRKEVFDDAIDISDVGDALESSAAFRESIQEQYEAEISKIHRSGEIGKIAETSVPYEPPHVENPHAHATPDPALVLLQGAQLIKTLKDAIDLRKKKSQE